jgi:hypothetical protein
VFRVCAWCERLLGVTPPLSDPELTHGICGRCAERIQREELHSGRCLVIVRRSGPALRDRLETLTVGLPNVVMRVDSRVADRRRGGPAPSRERRRAERRRPLHPSQVQAWRTLGVYVARGMP